MQMSQSMPPLRVWFLSDGKPGHRNQLRGLAARLGAIAPLDSTWFELMQERPLRMHARILHRPLADPTTATPEMVVAAGHRGHKFLLLLRCLYGCFTVVLMRPTFPIRWFHACIIPRHDQPPPRNRVLPTLGVLNQITPSTAPRNPNSGLILAGGHSKHFGWDNQALARQIHSIARIQSDVRWEVTDSRRTPAEFADLLARNPPANLSFTSHHDTASGWIGRRLEAAGQVWVTPDSVSMIYESLTAGAPTGLLNLPEQHPTRIARGLHELVREHWVTPFGEWNSGRPLPAPPRPIWEADRAARWLLAKLERHRAGAPEKP